MSAYCFGARPADIDPIKRGDAARKIFLCIVVNLVCACLAFCYFIIADGGLLCIGTDFNTQQIPFSMLSAELASQGNTGWTSAIDLGSGFIGSMGFYSLGSPWFWISTMFPSEYFMYIVGGLYISKYVVAGLTSYLFFQRYVKNKNAAILASVLYAFSGFQCSNLLFYHFHDVVALFPLLLFTMDGLVLKKKRGFFALAVAANAYVNYFFFIGEVIFVLIYLVIRFVVPYGREGLKNLGICLIEGAIGLALAAVLFVPCVLSVMDNPRSFALDTTAYDFRRYMAIIRSLFLPGEMMSSQATVYSGEWTSCAAYLPMVGVIPTIAFIWKKKFNWLTLLMAISCIFALIPVLNGIFCLWTDWYCRWYYMPICFGALAGAVVMDNPEEYPVKRSSLIALAGTAAFIAMLVIVPALSGTGGLIFHKGVFAAQCIVAFVGILLTFFILGFGIKARYRLLYTFIPAFAAFTTGFTLYLYRDESPQDAALLYDTIGAASLVEDFSDGYRFTNVNDNTLTMPSALASSGSFCSTISGSIMDFYDIIGVERTVRAMDIVGMEYLLSAAYSLTDETDEVRDPLGVYSCNSVTLYVYQNAGINPIGFTYDSYILRSEIESVATTEERLVWMMRALVIDDEDEEKVKGTLTHIDMEGQDADPMRMAEYSAAHASEASSYAQWTDTEYISEITSTGGKYAFFSIPYDSGWTVNVNGQETDILYTGGFMAVPVSEGTNTIVFTYTTVGLSAGTIVTLAGAAAWIIYIILTHAAGASKRHAAAQREAGLRELGLSEMGLDAFGEYDDLEDLEKKLREMEDDIGNDIYDIFKDL